MSGLTLRVQIFQSATGGSDRPCAPRDCERCHGEQKLHRHGSYQRNADCSGSAKAVVERFLCPRCGTTFGVIPEEMFPYRSLPAVRFELWMNARFELPGSSAGGGARPPPASEVEKGCLLRALHRLQSRVPLLCGLLGQRMPMLKGEDIREFWRALRTIGRLGDILRFLARAFKTSLLADYLSLKPPWERELSSVRLTRQPA